MNPKKSGATLSEIAIINGTIVTPQEIIQHGTVLIENQRIKQVGSGRQVKVPQDASKIDTKNQLVVPGFIDLHLQGSFGYDVWDENETSFTELCKHLLSGGTTSFLATTEYHPPTFERLRNYCNKPTADPECSFGASWIHGKRNCRLPTADCLGIHLEGPFINPERKGGIPQESIQQPNKKILNNVYKLTGGHLKMMTIAPELKNALPLIKDLVNNGIVASIGHSNATFAEAKRGFDAGISHTTHIFNQLTAIHHREPGATLACLLDDRVTVQVICDGIHLDWEIIKLIYHLKGPDRIALITDAIRAAGLPNGIYSSQGHGRKSIVKDGKVTRPDGTIAGSTLTMNQAVANAVNQAGIPLLDAVQMATLTPAKILGLSHRIGSIAPNQDADIVILDNQFRVTQT
ncbi:MAG: N-acetylglucosamine-6-phosphate deacetylase, partial [bacterium]|nr:N-acetylglucosamine-6-phosphate deacetylase [bacterium]